MFVKSPLNYTGGKFKLLPQIIPLFPKKIVNFIDLFGGGGNVCVNVEAENTYYNDSLTQVVEFLKYCKETSSEEFLSRIDGIVKMYGLSRTNEDAQIKLRKDYNDGNRTPLMFYALVCTSFCNYIRFNKKGEFNLGFGKRCFNDEVKKVLVDFVDIMKNKNMSFLNLDFRKLKTSNFGDGDFVYLDPPYLISCVTYNENGKWAEDDENDLLGLLDKLNENKVKFALSNVLENKGQENSILKEWSKKYNIHNLVNDYKNSSHHRIKNDITTEVLITNY